MNRHAILDADWGAKVIAVLAGHLKEVETAAFKPEGTRVVTASYDGTAKIWDIPKP